MFTGIVTHQVEIVSIQDWHFQLTKPSDFFLNHGQSIAHDGACMTVESFDDESYRFFVMSESFDKTNFWSKSVWDTYNVELAMKIGDRLDGHMVAWHIDTVGTVTDLTHGDDGSLRLGVSFDPQYDPLVIPKGSIVLNGVSLTVVDIESGWCSVRLIPLTQELTNLWVLDIGSQLNIEFDMMGKYVTQRGRK